MPVAHSGTPARAHFARDGAPMYDPGIAAFRYNPPLSSGELRHSP